MTRQLLLDLTDPRYAYMFGFLQADGHVWQGPGQKGKVSVELGLEDRVILERFMALVPCRSSIRTRQRDTNFRIGYHSAIWSVHDLAFRTELARLGLTSGRKSATVSVPQVPFSEPDYFRGVIDGDGSLGVTARGYPFVSLVTASEPLAHDYVGFVERVTGVRKSFARNRRDHAINLAVFKETAQQLIEVLYPDSCLSLPRKIEKAREALRWRLPDGMRRVVGKRIWTEDEDSFVTSHPLEESVTALQRSKRSINMWLWRLRSR